MASGTMNKSDENTRNGLRADEIRHKLSDMFEVAADRAINHNLASDDRAGYIRAATGIAREIRKYDCQRKIGRKALYVNRRERNGTL